MLKGTRDVIARHGLGAGLRYGWNRAHQLFVLRVQVPLQDRWFAWRFGLELEVREETELSSAPDSEFRGHQPIPCASFTRAMRALGVRAGEDVFLDVGCGRGRALVLAARLPFKQVLGVEIVPELAAAAKRRVERLAPRLRCPSVRVVRADASRSPVPRQVTVVFLYQPFVGKVLQRFLDELERSLAEHPRPLRVAAANCHELDRLLRNHPRFERQELWHGIPWVLYRSAPL